MKVLAVPAVPALAALSARIQTQLQPTWAKLEAMPSRDRAALLLCTVAVVCAAEFMVLGPMANKRAAVASAGDQEVKAAQDAASQEAQTQLEALQALKARAKQVEAENSDQGVAKAQGESVAALLERALRSQGAKTVSLRSLGAEALADEAPSAAADAAAASHAHGAAAPAAAVASASTSAPARPLYKHRYELILAGDAASLAASAGMLEIGLAPLRIERTRLLPGKTDALQLVVTFGLVGTERSWLSL